MADRNICDLHNQCYASLKIYTAGRSIDPSVGRRHQLEAIISERDSLYSTVQEIAVEVNTVKAAWLADRARLQAFEQQMTHSNTTVQQQQQQQQQHVAMQAAVSYTHLTLPTIYSV